MGSCRRIDTPCRSRDAIAMFCNFPASYTTLFHRLPNHMLTRGHNRRSEESVEECARRCILETFFKCRGFDYEKTTRMCYLTELTTERAGGLNVNPGWDFYERTPGKR